MKIVQKYGGTSVGTPEKIRRIARRIATQREAGQTRIALVVSAMAGETNRLADLVTTMNPKASRTCFDMTVSSGEQVTVGLMSAALEAFGVHPRPLLAYQLGIETDDTHARARIRSISAERILQCWSEGEVPVVAGFQGVTTGLELTTLGRGGSDTSAVALAAALQSDLCEINTDVDGLYTADPRIVPNARLIERIDFDCALEMAALGSRVIHPRAVELAAKFTTNLIIRNSFGPDQQKGTSIVNPTAQEALEAPVVSGVTLDEKVTKVTIHQLPDDTQIVAKIFTAIAEHGANVDIIVHDHSPEARNPSLGFTVETSEIEHVRQALEEVLPEGCPYSAESEFAKVSVVGLGMASHPGVASRVFAILSDKRISIHMISTSEIKISCVVKASEGALASRCLHDGFI